MRVNERTNQEKRQSCRPRRTKGIDHNGPLITSISRPSMRAIMHGTVLIMVSPAWPRVNTKSSSRSSFSRSKKWAPLLPRPQLSLWRVPLRQLIFTDNTKKLSPTIFRAFCPSFQCRFYLRYGFSVAILFSLF